MATATTANELPIVIGEMGKPESITLTHLQARFLLGFLLDPDEVEQMIRYLQYDLGEVEEVMEVEPAPIPAVESKPIAPQSITPPVLPPLNTLPFDERMEALRLYGEQMATHKASQQPAAPKVESKPISPTPTPEPKVEPTPAPEPTPSTPKPKASRKPRRVKTPIVIVDVLSPISGGSALPGKPLPSPTATCTVSRPSITPNAQNGTGVEKITIASLERETTNERGLAALVQRAKEVGVTGAIHKMKADTLRARIALAESALTTKPVSAPVAVQPIATKPARKLVADFLNVLPDGRELYTAVYSDGSIENELSEATSSAAA